MKKFWCLFLVLSMVITLLGCNTDESGADTTTSPNEASNAPEGYYLAKTIQTLASSENEYLNQSNEVHYDECGRVVARTLSRGTLFTSIKFTYGEDGRISSVIYERTDTHKTQQTFDITYKKVSLAEADLSEKYSAEYFAFPDEFYVGSYSVEGEETAWSNFVFAYDENNNLIFENEGFLATPTFYSYHPNNKVKTKVVDTGSTIFISTYDEAGNVTSSKTIEKGTSKVLTESVYTRENGVLVSQKTFIHEDVSNKITYENGIIKSIKATENGKDTELVFELENEENGVRCYTAESQDEGIVYKYFYDNLNRQVKIYLFSGGESEQEQTITYYEDTNYSVKTELKAGSLTQITENVYEKK